MQHTPIVTIDGQARHVLMRKTDPVEPDELPLARQVSEQLHAALAPYQPAAGLAAPQIGISKSVFIYSFDRDPKNLETVINPSFIPIGNRIIEEWECCLSVLASQGIWKSAKVPRHASIQATYLNLQGETVVINLEGFAAKAFQHECDHLEGIVNINRQDATIQVFESRQALEVFMQNVKKLDATHYIPASNAGLKRR